MPDGFLDDTRFIYAQILVAQVDEYGVRTEHSYSCENKLTRFSVKERAEETDYIGIGSFATSSATATLSAMGMTDSERDFIKHSHAVEIDCGLYTKDSNGNKTSAHSAIPVFYGTITSYTEGNGSIELSMQDTVCSLVSGLFDPSGLNIQTTDDLVEAIADQSGCTFAFYPTAVNLPKVYEGKTFAEQIRYVAAVTGYNATVQHGIDGAAINFECYTLDGDYTINASMVYDAGNSLMKAVPVHGIYCNGQTYGNGAYGYTDCPYFTDGLLTPSQMIMIAHSSGELKWRGSLSDYKVVAGRSRVFRKKNGSNVTIAISAVERIFEGGGYYEIITSNQTVDVNAQDINYYSSYNKTVSGNVYSKGISVGGGNLLSSIRAVDAGGTYSGNSFGYTGVNVTIPAGCLYILEVMAYYGTVSPQKVALSKSSASVYSGNMVQEAGADSTGTRANMACVGRAESETTLYVWASPSGSGNLGIVITGLCLKYTI